MTPSIPGGGPLQGGRFPDFIIVGAMKSGTTSIHNILARHPDVFIPEGEVNFFDVDDVEQHPDFFVRTRRGWTFHDLDADFPRYLEWYRGFFEAAAPGQLIGEDTTTYLASGVAPERIARLLPRVRLIAMLRDPVNRAYSHYWHNVAAGRAVDSFEKTLCLNPGNLLRRGCYFEQLSRYAPFLEAGRMKVVLFEEFVKDSQRMIDDLCAFVGLASTVDLTGLDIHDNAARAPFWLPARLLCNRLYSSLIRHRKSFKNVPGMPGFRPGTGGSGLRSRSKAAAFWDALTGALPRRRYPPMRPDTREFLQKVFRRKNAGLSELIGRDVSEHWAYMR